MINVSNINNRISFTLIEKSLLEKVKCPLSTWKQNAKKFPKLSCLARKYILAPASTVYS